jgi:excisionase family DNA binding protein
MERIAYSIQEFADMLGVSRDLVNDMLRDQQVKSLKAGNRRLIPATAIDEYLASAE